MADMILDGDEPDGPVAAQERDVGAQRAHAAAACRHLYALSDLDASRAAPDVHLGADRYALPDRYAQPDGPAGAGTLGLVMLGAGFALYAADRADGRRAGRRDRRVVEGRPGPPDPSVGDRTARSGAPPAASRASGHCGPSSSASPSPASISASVG